MTPAMAASDTGRIAIPPLPASPTVLLMVDFVNPLDFPGADALAPAALAAARATARLRRALSREDTQAIYANDNYGMWHSDFMHLWQRCSRGRGPSAELAQRLRPRRHDYTILKPRHSAFYSTPLDLLLRQLECKQVILTGMATDSCVLASAMDAYLRGYRLWVPSDCVAAENQEVSEQALALMRRVLKADTRPAWP